MDITHEFEKVSVFLAKNGFVPVLKQMAVPAMSPVITLGMTGQQPPHDGSHGHRAGSQKQMKMVGDKRPCIARRLSFFQNQGQALYKVMAILIIIKYPAAFNVSVI